MLESMKKYRQTKKGKETTKKYRKKYYEQNQKNNK